jgi:xanthine dehydrogenase accessory factor
MAWKELRQIIAQYECANGPFALATIVRAVGSTYRRPGARMLVTPDERYVGRLSAGCLEEEIAERAQEVIQTGARANWNFDLRSRFACDGSIEVLVERLVKPNAFINGLFGVLNERRPIVVATNYRSLEALAGTRLVNGQDFDPEEEFVQEIKPPVRLLIFGDQFDVEPLAHLGGYLGWVVEIFADAGQIPTGDARTAGIVMSHNFGRDLAALKHMFAGRFEYVGLLGPRRRKQRLINHLLDEGYPPDRVSRLRSPAGLDIGSETAEEIALAIIAEVQAALMGRTGGYLSERQDAIHSLEEPTLWHATS